MASACTASAGLAAGPLSLVSSVSQSSSKFSPIRPVVVRRQEGRQCVRASSQEEGVSLRHAAAVGALAAALATGSPMMSPQVAFAAEPTHVYQLAASDNVPEEVNDVLSKAPSNVRDRVEENAANIQEPKKAAFNLGFPPAVLLGAVGLIFITAGGLSQIFGPAKK
ncbi:hypothetical protein KFL_000440260 [Klebsormidium nitens]|uniref:Uncharacterized protein n=1 Tax=Klebsormidium nitens TaxID=105231 RepID=A0A1Y1HN09_KLENI|nr:hypothetical protein KFL_000440260 [Klebsormidium nitens]|eukprot:GAQ80025.1 hypothetical protein KFL_000440260 [Klebsormidium nitens]